MTTFERILRQAEEAKRVKLSTLDLKKGFEWWRDPTIWEDIGDYDHRPVEYEFLTVMREQYYRPTLKPLTSAQKEQLETLEGDVLLTA